MAKKYNIWMDPKGYMFGSNPQKQRVALLDAMKRISDCANIVFVEKEKEHQAKIRINFATEAALNGDLGRGSSNGKIWINTTRDVGLAIGLHDRIDAALLEHEIVCHVFGFKHLPFEDKYRKCSCHPWLGNHLCYNTVVRMQRWAGNPNKKFSCSEKEYLAKDINEITKQRDDLIEKAYALAVKRTASRDIPYRKSATVEVRAMWRQVANIHKQIVKKMTKWHEITRDWANVQMVY